jgi:hypothetical protein
MSIPYRFPIVYKIDMQSTSGMRIAGSELQYQKFQTSISESRSFQLQYQAWTKIQTIRLLFFNELSSAKMGVIMRLASAADSEWATFSSGASPRPSLQAGLLASHLVCPNSFLGLLCL